MVELGKFFVQKSLQFREEKPMAIVLMEEITMGLGEVKGSLDQAVATLTDILEDLSPALRGHFEELFKISFLSPLQSRQDALNVLLNRLTENEEEED